MRRILFSRPEYQPSFIVADYWKVPGRYVYCDTLIGCIGETAYCYWSTLIYRLGMRLDVRK